MKKSLIFTAAAATIFAASLFISCQNFLSGNALKNELESEIEYAKTPDVTVSITSNNQYGTLGQTGGTYKVGTKNLELKLEVNDTYQFVKWQVLDGAGEEVGCTKDDAIYIKNPESADTVYAIQKQVSGYKISAVCKLRPYVTAASPANVSTGVSRDRSIVITFSENIDESNFRYSTEEAAALEAKGYELLKDSDDKAYGYSKSCIVYYKNIKIRNANNTAQNLLEYFGAPEVSGKKVTITPKSNAENQFELDSNGYKDIEVTLSGISNDGIEMLEDYSWSYRVNSTTDSKASITFSALDSDGITRTGTLDYTGTQSFNVGDSFTVTFEPTDSYEFIKWSVKGNSDGNIVTVENGRQLTFTVYGSADGVIISPVCEKLETSTILFATTAGTVSPSGYVDKKRKDTIPLVCTVDSDYAFTKWLVKNTLTNEIYDDEKAALYFKFDDVYAATTNVQILQDNVNLSIEADAIERACIEAKTPEGESNPVNRDTKIRIRLSSGITESSLYYTQAEVEKFLGQKYKILAESENDGVYVKPYGYYKTDSDLSSYVFKNVSIKDDTDGTNYLKYYGCPYLADTKGDQIIIPVKKVWKNGKVSDEDGDNLPKNRVIKVSLGTDYGTEVNGVLVNMKNKNLVWWYKTNDTFDPTYPALNSISITGDSYSGSQTFENYKDSTTSHNLTEPVSAFDASKKDDYRSWYVKTAADGTAKITINLTASDSNKNLQSVTLVAQQVLDENYSSDSSITKKMILPVVLSGTDGTCTDYSIDLRNNSTLGLEQDGLYRLYFELQDDVGNITSTDMGKTSYSWNADEKKNVEYNSGSFFYVLLDETNSTSKNDSVIKYFYRNRKVIVDNIKDIFTKDMDIVESTATLIDADNTESDKTDCLSSSTYIFTGLTNGKNNTLRFTFKDVVGNKISYDYTLTAGIRTGMCLYSDGRFSDQVYSDDKSGVVVSSDYTNIFVARIATDTRKGSAYTGTETGGTITIDDSSYTYVLPSVNQLSIVKNNLSALTKFGADDGSRVNNLWISFSLGDVDKAKLVWGNFYYTSEYLNPIYVNNMSNGHTIDGYKLFNMSTGLDKIQGTKVDYEGYYDYSYTRKFTAYYSVSNCYDNRELYYNLKYVLTFTDSE